MSQAKSWGVTDAFRERIEPLIREIFSQAIPSHSDPAVPSEKIKETNVGTVPDRGKHSAARPEEVAISQSMAIIGSGFSTGLHATKMTGQAFGCLEPAIPARAP